MTVILDQFIHTLVESGLMTAEEVSSVHRRPAARGAARADGEDLAKLLFQRKKLTKFQTQAIYQGKTKGLVLGNYVVLDKIGQGGMGQVYKAQHKRMKRVVALKVLPSAMTKTPEAVQRFQREVEAAAKLAHPNIVTAYDADEADGVHFLVMEYVEGEDLAELVREQGHACRSSKAARLRDSRRPEDCEYAHDQGVVHRDIKPSNLLLDDNRARSRSSTWAWPDWSRRSARHDSTAAASLTQSGPGDGHHRLHGARAGDGHAQGRPSGRHLQPRLHAVLPADRPAGVSAATRWPRRSWPIAKTRSLRCEPCGPTCRRGSTPFSRRWSPSARRIGTAR